MSGKASQGATGTTAALDRHLGVSPPGSSVRTEILAGATTFVAMAYIVMVNPAILSDAGLPVAAVATRIAAGFATRAMGLVANAPLALAPGVGLNADFSYTVAPRMGVPMIAPLAEIDWDDA